MFGDILHVAKGALPREISEELGNKKAAPLAEPSSKLFQGGELLPSGSFAPGAPGWPAPGLVVTLVALVASQGEMPCPGRCE